MMPMSSFHWSENYFLLASSSFMNNRWTQLIKIIIRISNSFLFYNLIVLVRLANKQLRSLSIDTPFRAIPTKSNFSVLATAATVKIAPSNNIHQLPISSSRLCIPHYIRRKANTLPKSSFKSLLIVTSLIQKSNKMSLLQQVP